MGVHVFPLKFTGRSGIGEFREFADVDIKVNEKNAPASPFLKEMADGAIVRSI